jgi:hypothetical protein
MGDPAESGIAGGSEFSPGEVTQKGSYIMQQTEPNVDRQLKALQSGSFFERRKAAEELGALSTTSQQIVDALIQTLSNDSDPAVRNAAASALHQPVHAAFVQADPTRSKNVADAIQRK